ncbi:hypothetical protein PR202_ga07522 [Eleusine coracana subsp. coracana]|uniref:FAS1 domain-containing protein n=1 Tax=Eleusine coracana subsp. coracana TaxID=191504 RepID=A0AAV5C085_ELECO|nr:hypothetical protein PR202_ga07522 [Eleusine coracana subsp. coracana]
MLSLLATTMPLAIRGLLVLVLVLLSSAAPAACLHAAARNATAILSACPGLAEFGRALEDTGIAAAINNSPAGAVTVLAVDDARMAEARGSGIPSEALRRALSRHVLAGYHDDASLRRLLLTRTQTGGSADAVVAPTLLDAGAVKIVARGGAGPPGAWRSSPWTMTRGSPPRSTSAAARPEPSESRLVSQDAVNIVAQSSSASAPRGGRVAFVAPQQDARDGARAAVPPAQTQQVTVHTRSTSALQEEGEVTSPAAEAAAAPPEPRAADDDSAPAPAPSAPPEHNPTDARIAWAIWKTRNKMTIEKKFPKPKDALITGITLLQKWKVLLREKDEKTVDKMVAKLLSIVKNENILQVGTTDIVEW